MDATGSLRELVRRLRSPEGLAGLALVCCLLWACWPTLALLWGQWGSDPQYSHGYLVPAFAAYLLWARRRQDKAPSAGPSWWGVALLAAGLGLYFAGAYIFFDWLRGAALIPCVAGVVVLFCGPRALRWAWPGVGFLLFMVPLPYRLEVALAYPLRRIATLSSTYALQTLGFTAFSEGNVIRMGEVHLGVVEACSGLSMLVIFVALSAAVALLVNRPLLDRALILCSSVPIALLANIIRITVTGVLYKTVGTYWAELVFHDLAGWLMMPLALVFLWIELRLLSWILVQRPQGSESTSWLGLAPSSGVPARAGQTGTDEPYGFVRRPLLPGGGR